MRRADGYSPLSLILMVKLFEHQQEVLGKLHNGSILWGGTGSGKSITGLAYYYIRECEGMKKPKDLYIITTARKRDTGEWEGELSKWGLSPASQRPKIFIDSWNNIKKYVDVKACFFLFDEQRVVGYGAWTKAFLKITAQNRWILLSATPGDCWMDYMPVFIANGFYRNKTEFQHLHVIYNNFNKRYLQIKGYRNERLLRQHRDEVLVGMSYDKPTVRHSETVKVSYDCVRYDAVMKTRFNPYTEAPIKEISELCYTLRRVVNSDQRRMEELKFLMYEHRKAIIFYNFNYELEAIQTALDEINWPHAEWNGHRHEPIPNESAWGYIVQYTAGAEGWNCVETDTIIFYSKSYSYKTMEQAAGRIDRINTGYHDLYYYYMTTDSPIDRAMNRALSNKKNFNESAFFGKMGRL